MYFLGNAATCILMSQPATSLAHLYKVMSATPVAIVLGISCFVVMAPGASAT